GQIVQTRRIQVRIRAGSQRRDLISVHDSRVLARRVIASATYRLNTHRPRGDLSVPDRDVQLVGFRRLNHLAAPRVYGVDAWLTGYAGHPAGPQIEYAHTIDDDLVAKRTQDVSRFDPYLPRLELGPVLLGLGNKANLGSAYDTPTVQQAIVPAQLRSKILLLEVEIVRRYQLPREVTRAFRYTVIAWHCIARRRGLHKLVS